MVVCAVPGCNSNNDKRLKRNKTTKKKVDFYRFPRNDKRSRVWLECCDRKDNNPKNLYICSKHFKPEDYARNLMHELLNYHPKNSKRLKINAIPTLNMPPSMKNRKLTGSGLEGSERIAEKPIIVQLPQKLEENVSASSVSENRTNDGFGNNTIPTQNPIPSTLIVETESKSDIPNYIQPLDKVPSKVDKSSSIVRIPSEMNEEDTAKWHQRRLSFLDHVVWIWLNRSRYVDPKIVSNNALIKSKAKETANILGTFILTPTKWIHSFKANHKLWNLKRKHTSSNLSLNILDIIAEEWPKFCYEGEKLFDDSDSKNTVYEEVAPEEATGEENEDPIETYDDALECLKMVEDYALCEGNSMAVELISQIERVLRNRKL